MVTVLLESINQILYSIGEYFNNVVRELSTLSCCYNKTW